MQESTFCWQQIKLPTFSAEKYMAVCESDTASILVYFVTHLAMLRAAVKPSCSSHLIPDNVGLPRISGMYQPPRQFNMPGIRRGARMRFYLHNSPVLCRSPPYCLLHECGRGLVVLLPTGPQHLAHVRLFACPSFNLLVVGDQPVPFHLLSYLNLHVNA